jgi:hypothetical protein
MGDLHIDGSITLKELMQTEYEHVDRGNIGQGTVRW